MSVSIQEARPLMISSYFVKEDGNPIEKTQDEWASYWNHRWGRLPTMADFYQVFKQLRTCPIEDKLNALGVRGTGISIATNTKLSYKGNKAKIIHSSEYQEDIREIEVDARYSEIDLDNPSFDFEGSVWVTGLGMLISDPERSRELYNQKKERQDGYGEFLQALFDTQDSLEEISKTFKILFRGISGKRLSKYVIPPPYFTREEGGERPIFLDFDTFTKPGRFGDENTRITSGKFRISARLPRHEGRSLGVYDLEKHLNL